MENSDSGAAGRRAQAARDGVVAVGKEASERAAEAARKAKAIALPGLSRAKEDGARKWSEIDPDVKRQVALSLLTSAAVATGERLKRHNRLGVRLVGLGLAAAAPTIATHTARQVSNAAGNADLKTRPAEAAGGPDNIGSANLSELADALGARRPPDPEDIYREGSDALELAYPLPEELAALPWESLSRRNRFFVLVAAWVRREADGIQLLKSGQLEQAREVFQECLVRAQHMQAPELAVRSCENLGELSVLSGDEAGAQKWRAEAGRIMHR